MRTITTAQTAVLATTKRSTWAKFEVYDGSSWLDMSDHVDRDWLVKLSWGEAVDGRFSDLTATLRTRIDNVSLSPWVTNSEANDPNVAIEVTHPVRLSTATMPYGTEPDSGDYLRVFDGFIHEIDVGPETMAVRCLDVAGHLAVDYIEAETTYGTAAGRDVESVMQDILDDWSSQSQTLYSENGSGATPWNPADTPGWAITEWKQKREPVLNVLVRLADMIGWALRVRWQTTTGSHELQLYEPDRANTTPDRTFGPEEYIRIGNAKLSRADIRNVIRVVYRDSAGAWQVYTATDANSVTKYGRLWMEIAEEDTSQINTGTEAGALAVAAKSDLAEPTIQLPVELPYFWPAQLHDLYRITTNDTQFDSNQDLAVVSYRHDIDGTKARTQLVLRGKPSTGVKRWRTRNAIQQRRTYGYNNIETDTALIGNLCPNGDFGSWSSK